MLRQVSNPVFCPENSLGYVNEIIFSHTHEEKQAPTDVFYCVITSETEEVLRKGLIVMYPW